MGLLYCSNNASHDLASPGFPLYMEYTGSIPGSGVTLQVSAQRTI